MEYIGNKRGKKRSKRKRRYINNKQSRTQIKIEVKSKRGQRVIKKQKVQIKKEKIDCTMEASAFWENYKVAYEWQKRHNVTWWKTRCYALEHENHILRETLRNFVQHKKFSHDLTRPDEVKQHNVENVESNQEYEYTDQSNNGNDNTEDNLEFHLDEDMMNFLAQSIQHKIELKIKRESEDAIKKSEENDERTIEGSLSRFRKRTDDAKLLYGEASSRILAMETALQTSTERHKDKSKPQYWPNIPIKL